ncbi:hypothetical protein Moror_8265 [Moniliophthora roreri MCA 2997]|uniref:Uncharacterized protein n=2 Tax=Moniliophthora roreri TaxID=221103 RepID=V2XP30_MONRO|nr:hypothetical protein Moror_8265 [Moniliophthora roreri MCA 2997]KAI3607554.1 hypothetical protein WG66_005112 [Moniliophthora roreri]
MSDKAASFGDVLSSGIQDVAALLPLLGTAQCERHVGSALEKGYLYAAAASLSLFGSLGIVRAAFATLLATIAYPFYGGKWLDDAGFATPGSVSSMVSIDKDTGLYGAELKLQKLLEEQHIDRPDMVLGFEWTGWKRAEDASYDAVEALRCLDQGRWDQGGASFSNYYRELVKDVMRMDLKELLRDINAMSRRLGFRGRHIIKIGLEPFVSWNALLITTSALSAILSISPYIFLANDRWNSPLSWVYPALRSFGSLLCVVCVQLALQRRIHRIINTSLAWMRVRQRHGAVSDEACGARLQVLEGRIRTYLLNGSSPGGLEEGWQDGLSTAEQQELNMLLVSDPALVMYQLLIAIGMAMVVAGYVGCFSIVGQTKLSAGPYVWFAMETVLSLIRISIWGSNPSWDESTRLTMSLRLHKSQDTYYPLITCPNNSEELGFVENAPSQKPFAVYTEAEFFATATAWIGPLQRLGLNAVTLYYALIVHKSFLASGADKEHKYLCITMLLTDSRSFSFLCRGRNSESIDLFASRLEALPSIGSYQVSIVSQVKSGNDGFLRSQLFRDIVAHAYRLSVRLFGDRRDKLHVKWNLSGFQTFHIPETPPDSAPLSVYDQEYIGLRRLWDLLLAYFQGPWHRISNGTDMDESTSFYCETLALIETTVLEVYMWCRERRFLDTCAGGGERLAAQLLPECVYAMQGRIAMEKREFLSRHKWDQSEHILEGLTGEQIRIGWDNLQTELTKLRMYAPNNNFYRLIKAVWERIHVEEEIESIMELCIHLKVLPASIYMALNIDATNTGVEGLQKELHMLLRLLKAIAKVQTPVTGVPYVSVKEALTLTGISMNERLCALALDPQLLRHGVPGTPSEGVSKGFKKDSLGRILDVIAHPNQKGQPEQMTTLIIQSAELLSEYFPRVAVTNHVTKNPNIICLSGMDCHWQGEDCEMPHCKAALANRQLWKEWVRRSPSFAYLVGFEGRFSHEVEAKGDSIELFDKGGCLVLLYCPDLGELTLSLSVRIGGDPMELSAVLISDQGNSPHIVTKTVARSDDPRAERVVFEFSNVPKGTGEIQVGRINGTFTWEIQGLIHVHWSSN